MKRTTIVVLMVLILVCGAYGGDISISAKAFDTYPDLLAGLLPTFAVPGISYSGLSLVDGIRTDIYGFAGGGFTRNEIWVDALGNPFNPGDVDVTDESYLDLQAYDRWEIDFAVGLMQGIIQRPDRERATIAAYAEYAFHWESTKENADRSYFFDGSPAMFPDKEGVAVNSLTFGAVYDMLDRGPVPKGIIADISLLTAPGFLANTVRGSSDFYTTLGVVKGYLPLYQIKQESGLNLFGIYLSDRIQADLIWGSAVPQDYKIDPALGTKARGFEKNSMGYGFTLVNNFDLRIAGPEIFVKDLYPRFHLFFDMGMFAGAYHNSTVTGSGFVSSTGFEAAVTFFNVVTLGYRGSFVLAGENMAQKLYFDEFMVGLQY